MEYLNQLIFNHLFPKENNANGFFLLVLKSIFFVLVGLLQKAGNKVS
jgi:hypothetical protein